MKTIGEEAVSVVLKLANTLSVSLMYNDFVISDGVLVISMVNILLRLKTESSTEYSTFFGPECGADKPERAPQGMSLNER